MQVKLERGAPILSIAAAQPMNGARGGDCSASPTGCESKFAPAPCGPRSAWLSRALRLSLPCRGEASDYLHNQRNRERENPRSTLDMGDYFLFTLWASIWYPSRQHDRQRICPILSSRDKTLLLQSITALSRWQIEMS